MDQATKDARQAELEREREEKLSRLLTEVERSLPLLGGEQLGPDAAMQCGRVALAMDQHDRAARFFRRVLAVKPEHGPAHNGLGQVAFALGDHAAAEASFVAAYRADKTMTVALENLLLMYDRTPFLKQRWLDKRFPSPDELLAMREDEDDWEYQPLVSLIMPLHNTPLDYIRESLDSLLAQIYPNWELCLAHDCSTDPRIAPLLDDYARRDRRIRVQHLPQNLHIAGASNKALEMARGEFIGFLDSDDMLVPHTLHQCVRALQELRELDFIYTDNAVIGEHGELRGLMLKPAWSPEFYMSTNYIVHFCLYSRRLVEAIGPFREDEGHKGVQDVDIKARMLGLTDRVAFIPEVLYLWRETDVSVSSSSRAKSYVLENARRTYDEVLQRRGFNGRVETPAIGERAGRGIYKINVPVDSPRTITVVSFLRGGRRQAERLRQLVAATPGGMLDLCLCVAPGQDPGAAGPDVHTIASDADLTRLLAGRTSDYVLFLDPCCVPQGTAWLSELRGYLDFDAGIGVAGAKILSRQGRVAYGGYLLLDDVEVENEGLDDTCTGHWYNNTVAHNLCAVSRYALMTRRDLFLALGGLRRERYGAFWDVDYCLRAGQAGRRTVYNPWAALVLENDIQLAAEAEGRARLREDWAPVFGADPHYSPGYSRTEQYALDGEADIGVSIRRAAGYLKAAPVVAPGRIDLPEPAAPAVLRHGRSRALRINFVLPNSPNITGGPLAILEYANRLLDRGHDVSVTTYPDLFWGSAGPFPWFDFRGTLHYPALRAHLTNQQAPPAGTSEEMQFYRALTARLLRLGNMDVLKDYLLSIGNPIEDKLKAGLDAHVLTYLKWAYLLDAIPECDLNIATYWETAVPVYLSGKGKPVYFMQHYEEVFYPSHYGAMLAKLGVRTSYGLPMHKVANSSWLRKVMREKFGQDVPFSNNGIELADFNPRPKQSAEDGVLRVVTYARPEEWKGFGDAVEAMGRVRRAWNGPLEWHVFGYLNHAMPADNPVAPYTYHPKLSFKELADLYARCDVALCPSWYESFPLPPLEAMASGTAAVTTDLGTEDYAHHEQTALVVQPRDVDAMAQAVLRLLGDPALRGKLAASGRAMAETFDWPAAVDRRERILLDIHEGRVGYDVFTSAQNGFVDHAGIPFEQAPADIAVADRTLVRSTSGPAVYLVDRGSKRHLVEGYFLDGTPLENAAPRDIDPVTMYRIPTGSPILSTADLPRLTETPAALPVEPEPAASTSD